MTTGHLKCEYLLIWMRNMQNCEMHKIDISSQVMKNFNINSIDYTVTQGFLSEY